jgi:hypothetical protein
MSVKTKVQRASSVVSAVIAPRPEAANDTDVLDTLKADHREVAGLLAELEEEDGAAQRRRLVQQIKAALVPHTKAEEQVVYEALLSRREKETQQHGLEATLEHEWASKTLQRLDGVENAASAEHKATAKVLKDRVEHHVEEEESTIWSDLKKILSREERMAMNAEFVAAKAKVRVS